MPQRKYLIGQKFGRLTVVAIAAESEWTPSPFRKGRQPVPWKCLCDCGKTVFTDTSHLTKGNTRSCGCLQRDVTSVRARSHGHSTGGKLSPTYHSWAAMWTRVTNPRQRSFKDYGARGITVCPEWKSFERFLADMGERPSGLTLERCRVNEGYRPDNCYWADGETQGNNRQAQRKYFVDGRWYGLLQLSRYWGLNPYQTRKRISNSSIKDNTGGVYGLALDAQAERHEGR